MANPKILEFKGKDMMEEGCLSVPEALVDIERAERIVVQGLNEKGEFVEVELKGLLARVIQHEIDHLNGKLIVDYMNILQKIRHKFNRKKGK